MREFTKNIFTRRGFDDKGFIDGDIILANRQFEIYNEIQLNAVAEGEQIVDREYNRPLVKVGGVMKQLKADSDGLIYYDTPVLQAGGSTGSGSSGGSTVITSSNLYVARLAITSADVPSTLTLGTVPAGYILEEIVISYSVAFGSDNRIALNDGSTLVSATRIDNRVIPIWKPYSAGTAISVILTGTPSTGSAWILLKAITVS